MIVNDTTAKIKEIFNFAEKSEFEGGGEFALECINTFLAFASEIKKDYSFYPYWAKTVRFGLITHLSLLIGKFEKYCLITGHIDYMADFYTSHGDEVWTFAMSLSLDERIDLVEPYFSKYLEEKINSHGKNYLSHLGSCMRHHKFYYEFFLSAPPNLAYLSRIQ
jgi:hypothetical protein